MVYKVELLDLNALFTHVTGATAALARLDERLARSPVRDGFIERQHFADAAAVLWLEGELVHAEDLVLHDAHMDIRMPTHELTRAHAVLRARRQIAANKPDWALSSEGLRVLTRRGRADAGQTTAPNNMDATLATASTQLGTVAQTDVGADDAQSLEPAGTDALSKAMEAIDAVLDRSAKVLDGQKPEPRPFRQTTQDQPDLVYDPDWDEEERLAQWQEVTGQTEMFPAVLRSAILIDAWAGIDVLQRAPWLGPLLVSSLLRQDGLAAHHLPAWSIGAKQIPRERRRALDRTVRLTALAEAIREAALTGLKEHDRLLQAKAQMERRLKGKRSNSKLPTLIAFALSRPLITAPLAAKELKLSLPGALNLIGELGLREVTGRGRFRAWAAA